MKALVFLFLFLAACSQKLGIDGPPPLPPGHAQVTISQSGAVVTRTKFDNMNGWNYFRCHKVGTVFQIQARRYTDPNDSEVVHTFELFFPDSKELEQGQQVRWSGNPLMVTGQMMKDKDQRLGGVSGACMAKLQFAGNVVTGEISCSNFESDTGLGIFDFDILDLLCTIT